MVLVGEILLYIGCVGISAFCTRQAVLICKKINRNNQEGADIAVVEYQDTDAEALTRQLITESTVSSDSIRPPRIPSESIPIPTQQEKQQQLHIHIANNELTWDQFIPLSPRVRRIRKSLDSQDSAKKSLGTPVSGETDHSEPSDSEDLKEETVISVKYKLKPVLERDTEEYCDSAEDIKNSDTKEFYLDRIRRIHCLRDNF